MPGVSGCDVTWRMRFSHGPDTEQVHGVVLAPGLANNRSRGRTRCGSIIYLDIVSRNNGWTDDPVDCLECLAAD